MERARCAGMPGVGVQVAAWTGAKSCGMAAMLMLASGAAWAQDSVLVGDYNGSKVVKFDFPSGAPLTHFVGNGMTSMVNNTAMTLGPEGNLYIAADTSDRVLRVDGRTGVPLGDFVTAGSGGLDRPYGLAFGPDGRLYVSSFTGASVLVYSGTTGAFIGTFVPPGSGTLSQAQGIAFGPSGNLFVCSAGNDKVLEYHGVSGAFVGEALASGQLGINEPRALLFDAAGRMYVSSRLSNSIVVKDPFAGASVLTSFSTNNQINQPGCMTLTSAGEILVACQGNGTVQRINRLTGASGGTLVLAGAGGMTNVVFGLQYLRSTEPCYANCDGSTIAPILNPTDFQCFLQRYRTGCP